MGVGMLKVLEDAKSLAPGRAGGRVVSRDVVGVAEAGEAVRVVVVGADFAIQIDGVLVAGDGVGMVAEEIRDVAGAVPAGGLSVEIFQCPEQVEGLAAVAQCLLMIAELGVVPAG